MSWKVTVCQSGHPWANWSPVQTVQWWFGERFGRELLKMSLLMNCFSFTLRR